MVCECESKQIYLLQRSSVWMSEQTGGGFRTQRTMMTTIFKKISPFALGVTLLTAQVIQLPKAQAASLGLGGSSDPTLLEPSVPLDPASTETGNTSEPGNSSTEVTASAGACTTLKATSSQTASAKTESTTSNPSSLSYQSDKLASASVPGTTPDLAPDPTSSSQASDPQLVAQLSTEGDCCEIGGNSTCELAGAPPAAVGGAGLAGAPLALLGGIPLAAAIPLALGGGDGSNVPEPSETAGLVAGFGLLGLWASRRLRSDKTKGSDQTKR